MIKIDKNPHFSTTVDYVLVMGMGITFLNTIFYTVTNENFRFFRFFLFFHISSKIIFFISAPLNKTAHLE